MNITLNIEADNHVELQEAIIGLAGVLGGQAARQPEKTKRNTQGVTKPEKQPDSDPVEPDTAEDTTISENEHGDGETTEDSGAVTEEIPTIVELRAAASEKGKTAEGKKSIKVLLDAFESKSISDVPEDKRAAFLTKLSAL